MISLVFPRSLSVYHSQYPMSARLVGFGYLYRHSKKHRGRICSVERKPAMAEDLTAGIHAMGGHLPFAPSVVQVYC